MYILGRKHSEETKKILSEKSTEYNNRPEVKEKHRQIMITLNEKYKNGEISEKWKQAIANRSKPRTNFRNINLTEEHRQKLSRYSTEYFADSSNRKKHSDSMRKANGRKVEQYSKENVLLASYDSISEAADKVSVNRKSIQSNASGHLKTAGGFIWKYVA